jgi:hypothetical protein
MDKAKNSNSESYAASSEPFGFSMFDILTLIAIDCLCDVAEQGNSLPYFAFTFHLKLTTSVV